VNQSRGARIPECGEALILADARRFVLDAADAGLRGWWFRAKAQDGSCVLQGNLELFWDPQARAWRPGDAPKSDAPSPLPWSMRQTRQPQQKQIE